LFLHPLVESFILRRLLFVYDALEDDPAAAGDFDLDMINPFLARDINRTREGCLGKLSTSS
jgi:hypothetical protein